MKKILVLMVLVLAVGCTVENEETLPVVEAKQATSTYDWTNHVSDNPQTSHTLEGMRIATIFGLTPKEKEQLRFNLEHFGAVFVSNGGELKVSTTTLNPDRSPGMATQTRVEVSYLFKEEVVMTSFEMTSGDLASPDAISMTLVEGIVQKLSEQFRLERS